MSVGYEPRPGAFDPKNVNFWGHFCFIIYQCKEIKRGKMYDLKYFSQLMYLIILFAVSGCISGANLSPYPNPPTDSLTPRVFYTYHINPTETPPTPIPILISPTPIQLPQIDGPVGEYCSNQPPVFLPIADAQGLTDDEIAEKLLNLYLDYYNNSEAPGGCRIDGYRIDKVSYEERIETLGLEPKGDFMRGTQFSVKLIQVPSDWMAWSGQIDQQNWLHTGKYMAVFRTEDGYTMEFANV